MALCMPVGAENMTPVQVALEVALHELTTLNGLRVTDIPDVETTMVIDTREATSLIARTLTEPGEPVCSDSQVS